MSVRSGEQRISLCFVCIRIDDYCLLAVVLKWDRRQARDSTSFSIVKFQLDRDDGSQGFTAFLTYILYLNSIRLVS